MKALNTAMWNVLTVLKTLLAGGSDLDLQRLSGMLAQLLVSHNWAGF